MENKLSISVKDFQTITIFLIEFRNRLIENDCLNICMESTGKYYILNVIVANFKLVKCIKGENAKLIADLFKLGIARGSFIPEK